MLAVCGPTAAGKSTLADELADELTERLSDAQVAPVGAGGRVPVVAVDSMQVYEGLSEITNQSRRRPAALVGCVPVTERWTVARHAEAAEVVIGASDRVVLDAGTGMYLNAILLDLPLAPAVPEEVRREALLASAAEANPRRAARERELRAVGAAERGSIWQGPLKRETTIVYLRPDRAVIDAAIKRRSAMIADRGLEEAKALQDALDRGVRVNPAVLEAVGVKELLARANRELSREQAAERIAARTRRLARRQLRWFDKLARTLHGSAEVLVTDNPSDRRVWHTMHGRMGL